GAGAALRAEHLGAGLLVDVALAEDDVGAVIRRGALCGEVQHRLTAAGQRCGADARPDDDDLDLGHGAAQTRTRLDDHVRHGCSATSRTTTSDESKLNTICLLCTVAMRRHTTHCRSIR